MKSLIVALVTLASASQVPLQPLDQAPIQDESQQGPEKFLLEFGPGETQWVTEDEKWELKRNGRKFMDITFGTPGESLRIAQQKTVQFPDRLTQNDDVVPLFQQLDKDNMYKNLERFSAFHTRYYYSDSGKESAAWLMGKVNATIAHSGADKYGATVEMFPHPWGQNSIIATIPGQSEKTIVIGAHQDSINLFLPSVLAAPGADDDGSGTVTILEALRALLTSDLIVQGKAANTIEFHWYSAEEGGLLGSQALFKSYEESGRDVKAMLQQDMTGYTAGTSAADQPESVGIITDFVDPGLTNFMKNVVKTYCDIPYVETKCGYACSDHASASKAGYPSAFVIESEFANSNKRIHTTFDTIDQLNFDHMLQHAKLTLATAYELSMAKFD